MKTGVSKPRWNLEKAKKCYYGGFRTQNWAIGQPK